MATGFLLTRYTTTPTAAMMATAAPTNTATGRPPVPEGGEAVELTVTPTIFDRERDPFVAVMLSE